MQTFTAAPGKRPRNDLVALETRLRADIRGEVRFDRGAKALYAADASNYRQIPLGAVIPADAEDAVRTIALCRQYGVPVLPRGGGTSLAGQCCNAAVVLDFSKYANRLIELDAGRRTARVEPGLILDRLRDAAEQQHLTFGPDPATHNRNTLGGMLGNNSCGVHSLMAGMTADNVDTLDIVTYRGLRLRVGATSADERAAIIRAGGARGAIYARLQALQERYAGEIRRRFPDIPRRVSGFNLPALLPEHGFNVAQALVGSEGTCVTVLEAAVTLVHSPPCRALAVLGYADVYAACDAVPELLTHRPVGLEGFDDRLIDHLRHREQHRADLDLLPDGKGWLLVEFGGETQAEADDRGQQLLGALRADHRPAAAKLIGDAGEQSRLWRVREAALGATAIDEHGRQFWPGWEDSAVPPERLGAYLRELRTLLDRRGFAASFYGHFGQGCLHTRIDFDFGSPRGRRRFHDFIDEAADLVLRYGGSLSGEHGDGQARGALLPRMFGTELVAAFREFKAIWDPDGMMNPGKVVDARPIDADLRLGQDYAPAPVRTFFRFPDDGGSFARATQRCVGVGLCRRQEGGTMCPSYMATNAEEHSTRGRAHLLFEMLQGETVRGWQDRQVREALDLCLACKGCKGECPVNVDMATYKAEYLAHYYAGRPRPVTAYTFGRIYWWSRLASHLPGLANLLTQTPLLSGVANAIAGAAPRRRLPAFAAETFTRWFAARPAKRTPDAGPRTVLLWPDTFTNHFYPETARAAVEVLEAAGFRVELPGRPLCCGRPLYDYGFLTQARSLLRQILDTLGPRLAAGMPVIVLEPSCLSVFRDELINLFPHDATARRLSRQSLQFSEFVEREAASFTLPALQGQALLQGHCHQKAILGLSTEETLLSKLGLTVEQPEPGCCGMAGAFGFEQQHYDVSVRIGERALLPAVRRAAPATLVVADGFSCRQQIAQTTRRRALHLAEVMRLALGAGARRGQESDRRRDSATSAAHAETPTP